MVEKLLKSKKTKVAPKKAIQEAPKKTVLVGTYRNDQLEKWPGFYNYPISKNDKIDVESAKKVNEIWLFNGAKDGRYFAAEFIGVKSREELKTEYGYPFTKKKAHGDAYLLFKISKTEVYNPASGLAENVIVRAKDFKTAKTTGKKIKAYLESPERNDPDLAKLVPSELTKLPREVLRVCEAAVQMDFFVWTTDFTEVKNEAPLSKMSPQVVMPNQCSNEADRLVQALPIDCILQGDSAEVLRRIPDCSIDLVVTSPPYDQLRDYNGFSLDLHEIGAQLFRVLKEGGVVAMVIQDSTKNFAKSLTSFRTIVDWCDNIGFKMFETVIYHKNGTEGAWWKQRFRVDHEYMPIFFKGERPAYFNKEPLKVPSKHGGKVMTGSGNRRTSGETTHTVTRPINLLKCRGTVWDYMMAGDKNPLKRKHPAVFPDKIPYDFIQCFCPENGIVLDPFVGCGSTAVTAKGLGRHYIGIDISAEYCALAKERIQKDSVRYAQSTFTI